MSAVVPRSDLSRRWRESSARCVFQKHASRPAWLSEARAHVRQHYPGDGLTESVLWELAAYGFGLPAVSP